ncbi:hypothetical protein [Malonomonas rubra]|uniref:hypothetical protein n=1 Tax=Malonomonas rubra TaxID=57040 RepID=UPI0026ED4432|nr:hypothetical protein [Malonomonas rubra]
MVDRKTGPEKVQMKIPAEVAKIMSKWGGHSVRLAAARGALPMSGPNLVTVLFVFYHGDDEELKKEALGTFRTLPAKILLSALQNPELHFSIIDLIVRIRYRDSVVMEAAMAHPEIGLRSLRFLAEKSSGDVLDILAHNDQLLVKVPDLKQAIINNSNADKVTKMRLGWVEPAPEQEPVVTSAQEEVDEKKHAEDVEGQEEGFGEIEELDELSKYQLLQEMPVAEKIKMALTGDKEWRGLLIREANKLVNTAVLKNPRVTEGEVLAVAKNRSSSDELIRIILLNREWMKLYEMKKALVMHPRTPLQNAMRFMTFLSEKDIRELSKSRNVSQAIVNNARRMLLSKKR